MDGRVIKILLAPAILALTAVALLWWLEWQDEEYKLMQSAKRCCEIATAGHYADLKPFMSGDLLSAVADRFGGEQTAFALMAQMDKADGARYGTPVITRFDEENGRAEMVIFRKSVDEPKGRRILVPWRRDADGQWRVPVDLLSNEESR